MDIGTPGPEPSSTAFPGYKQGAGIEVEQLVLYPFGMSTLQVVELAC